jgi:hypothetical protein
MYNPVTSTADQMGSATSLQIGLVAARVLPLAAALAVGVGVLFAWKPTRFVESFRWSRFSRDLALAAPIALVVVYGLILVVNPWQETPGNRRAAWPLVEVSFVVAPLLIRAAVDAPRSLRVAITAFIVVGMLALVNFRTARFNATDHASIRSEHQRIEAIIAGMPRGADTAVCLRAPNDWVTYRELAAPLFHQRKTWIGRSGELTGQQCDLVIVEESGGLIAPSDFVEIDAIQIRDHRWGIYSR